MYHIAIKDDWTQTKSKSLNFQILMFVYFLSILLIKIDMSLYMHLYYSHCLTMMTISIYKP